MRAALTAFTAALFLMGATASGHANGFDGHNGYFCKKIIIKYPVWGGFGHHNGGFVTKIIIVCNDSKSP